MPYHKREVKEKQNNPHGKYRREDQEKKDQERPQFAIRKNQKPYYSGKINK